MWATFSSWIIGLVTKEILQWITDKIVAIKADKAKQDAAHDANAAQSSDDVDALKKVTDQTSIEDQEKAADSALKNL